MILCCLSVQWTQVQTQSTSSSTSMRVSIFYPAHPESQPCSDGALLRPWNRSFDAQMGAAPSASELKSRLIPTAVETDVQASDGARSARRQGGTALHGRLDSAQVPSVQKLRKIIEDNLRTADLFRMDLDGSGTVDKRVCQVGGSSGIQRHREEIDRLTPLMRTAESRVLSSDATKRNA